MGQCLSITKRTPLRVRGALAGVIQNLLRSLWGKLFQKYCYGHYYLRFPCYVQGDQSYIAVLVWYPLFKGTRTTQPCLSGRVVPGIPVWKQCAFELEGINFLSRPFRDTSNISTPKITSIYWGRSISLFSLSNEYQAPGSGRGSQQIWTTDTTL